MANVYTVLTVCLYALLLVFSLAFAAFSCFLFRKCITRAKVTAKLADVEANATCITDDKRKQPLRLLTLPAKLHLEPVVYPSASRRSKRLPSYQRVIPNPFRARSGDKRPSVVDTTITEADAPKIDGTGGDSSSHHTNDSGPSTTSPISIPIPPCRPPRPTLLDDLLAGFPYDHEVARDMWFPLMNAETGRLELGVVRGARPASRYVQRDGKEGRVDFVLALKQEEEEKKSVFSIDEEEIDTTPLTPSNTLAEIVVVEKSRKSRKRDEKRRKKKRNGRSRVHVLEVPELYVNARPYEEIEAEEETRAVAATLAAKEAEDKEMTIEVSIEVEAGEEEALAAVAAAALAARDTRGAREECKFLQVPERFFG